MPPQFLSKLPRRTVQPVSLRIKFLIGFSVLFSIVFAGAFYWFYSFTTDRILSRLKSDMQSTLIGAAEGVDVEELMALYREGQPNTAGFSDDRRYDNQLKWLQTVHRIEPRAWLYTYVVNYARHNRRSGTAVVPPNALEMVYLTDLWAIYNPNKAAKFLESERAGAAAHQIFAQRQIVSTDIYTDRWGTWVSAFVPLENEQGQMVAVLGLDIEADYVVQVQQAIRQRVVTVFVLTYGILFGLIYALSSLLTRSLSDLTRSAERIGAGNYDLDLPSARHIAFPDELDRLTQVFESMVTNIQNREQLIREGKRTEDEMRLALQQERELNELKSRFVSMVSHELRTPLTVIRTSLELLDRYGDAASPDKKREYFQRCRQAIQMMNGLLEDVLTIGKAEAGKLALNPIPLNLERFCLEILEEMRMGSGGSHTLVFYSGGDRRGNFDPTLLRSILTNLLSNAMKYSAVNSTVELELLGKENVVTLEVRDQGIGIPQADQCRLFELFHRASNVNTVRGTGLGLAIVKQCVTCHQGEIKFSSKEGVGTTFTVHLPLCTKASSSPTIH